jgi:ABC-type branched-subunit amino acid transport system substrate-binding protein
MNPTPMTLLLAGLLALSCSTTTASGTTRTVLIDGQEVPAEDVARDLVEEGNDAARRRDDAGARAAYRRVLAELADTTSFGPATVGLARLQLEAGEARSAQENLERLLLADPTTPVADDARYLLAMAQLQQGDTKSAAPTLKSLVDKMPEGERAEGLARLGRELVAQGQGTEGARFLARAIEEGAGPRDALERELLFAVDSLVPFNDVRLLLETEARPGTLFDELLTMKLARVHLHLRDYPASSEMTNRYLQRYPAGRFAKQALALKQSLAARLVVDARTIGVLLPLSGEYQAYGKRALSAVKIGLGVNVKPDAPAEPQLDPATGEPVVVKKEKKSLEGSFTTPAGLKVVVRDTAGQPERAAALVRELVEKDHVIAILGDILLDTSLPAALAAEDAGVPLLSLSRRDGVADAGPWSFRLALTARKQARALVELAVDGIGMKRFAIMYPKHSFGVELMNELWDELEKRQAEVTAVESYAHDQTTFTAEAKSLVGRGMAGSSEVAECRQEAAKIENDYRRRKQLEGCNDLAKPIVDFEALFIPDSYRTVSYVIPALVAEDVLVTKDRRTVEAYIKTTNNKSVRPVQLLGVSMWNDPELGKRLGKQIDGAIFVDGFDATDATPRVQKFIQAFAGAHGSKPQLVEAQAHDGAALLGALLTGEGAARTRDSLRQKLIQVKEFPGVTGLVKFDEKGDSATQLRFFQVDGDRIESRDPAGLAKGASG